MASYLASRVRSAVARDADSARIRYLTPARAAAKLLAFPFAGRHRYFDRHGAKSVFVWVWVGC